MRRAIAVLAGLAVLGAAGFWWLTRPARVSAAALPAHEADPEAGQLIFTAGGCTSCHAAPGAEGEAKLLLSGGLRIESDFGTFVAPNISPHPQAGIGSWTEAQFVTAMRKGTSPDGQHYYPAFPYSSYSRMTDADLLDLFAYVQTLPP
ncbi:MAG: cytochrome c, partial [Rhodobacteraceae bacterium]|nr:cytochrome c [Paracoccaceae bacterium]